MQESPGEVGCQAWGGWKGGEGVKAKKIDTARCESEGSTQTLQEMHVDDA